MDSNMVIMGVQDKLPKDLLWQQQLKERLDKLDERQRDEFVAKIPMLGLKNPVLVFWVGSFIFGSFGVGRFMIGDKTLAIARLGLTISMYLCLFLAAALESSFFAVLMRIISLAVFGWWVADLFLVGKKLRNQNLDKLISNLPR